MLKNALLTFAMEQESRDVFNDYTCLHTGIGKINAAYAFTKYLNAIKTRPSMIINLGTAGSRKHQKGSIINCTSFIERDMDVTPLGFSPYQTPFSDPAETILKNGHRIQDLTEGCCGTGDHFDTSKKALEFDVVDMEAYALALICKRENMPFMCLKYISDGANNTAHEDFAVTLHKAAEALHSVLESFGPRS